MNRMANLNPQDVFTPRASAVNPRTYISRPDLETQLKRSLQIPKHVVIHGESGTGKTWLYKKVLGELGYHFEVANMGVCASAGSVVNVLRQTVCHEEVVESTTARDLQAGVPGFVQGTVKSEDKKAFNIDPFYSALQAVSVRSKGRPACLVFDNLEQVLREDKLVQELAGLLLLVDDERYAKHEVKILLVGTSNEVRRLIGGAAFAGTIANRLIEIPEVARLSPGQTRDLVNTGFLDLLGFEFSENIAYSDVFWRQIAYQSDRIPQFLHELCLHVAWAVEDQDGAISPDAFLMGMKDWVRSSLVKDVARVQPNLNAMATKIGRRNQVIYCLGRCQKYDFNRSDIERLVKEEFPVSSAGVMLNVAQILSDLASGSHPLITRHPKSNMYRFLDPKFRIVIRWLLFKAQDSEEITLRDFDNAITLWAPNRGPKQEV